MKERDQKYRAGVLLLSGRQLKFTITGSQHYMGQIRLPIFVQYLLNRKGAQNFQTMAMELVIQVTSPDINHLGPVSPYVNVGIHRNRFNDIRTNAEPCPNVKSSGDGPPGPPKVVKLQDYPISDNLRRLLKQGESTAFIQVLWTRVSHDT